MKVSFLPSKNNDPAAEGGVKIPYGPARRSAPRLRWFLILTLTFAPFAILFFNVVAGWFFITSPGQIWTESFSLTAPYPGTVDRVLVRRGDAVAQEQALLTLRKRTPEGRLEQITLYKAELEAENTAEASEIQSSQVGSLLEVSSETVAYYDEDRPAPKAGSGHPGGNGPGGQPAPRGSDFS